MAEEGQVIAVHSVEAWKEQLQKGSETKKLIVVDFTATWCGPCRFIAPVLEDLAKKTPQVIFLKVDVDELRTVAEEWNVESMPTFLFLIEGKEVERFSGANKEKLQEVTAKHLSAVTATAVTATAAASAS